MIGREHFSKKTVVGVILLLVLGALAGKFYADSTTAREFVSRARLRVHSVLTGSAKGTQSTTPTATGARSTSTSNSSGVTKKDGTTTAKQSANKGGRKCNIFNPASVPDAFHRATLRYSKGSAACYVYNVHDLISRSIIQGGSWEGAIVATMESVLNTDPTMGLIDIGCNLGVYTIVAAMQNHKSVAIDANINNVKRLWKSVLENKVDKRVKLLYNGISDRYSQFSVASPEAGNIGHSLLAAPKQGDTHLVKSILMDDLLEVIDFKKAIMKIDIEGHEYEAFHHADKLFTQVDIPIVMMEWAWLGKNANQQIPKFMIDFFKRHNYQAYGSIPSNVVLDMNAYKSWPWDVVWKKTKKTA